MKIRLRQELDLSRQTVSSDAEARHLEDAVAHLEEARIGTIHSFCTELLRERPVEARVDPAFQELSEDERQGLAAMRILGYTPWDLLDHAPEEQQRDMAEGVRVSYVGATRARDLLVVPAVGDVVREAWIQRPFASPWAKPTCPARAPRRKRHTRQAGAAGGKFCR